MIRKISVLAIAAVILTVPAFADDDATPGNGDGHYTFNKVAGGFVRLDTKTGEVALCGKRTVGWACQAAPEDRAVLENEIARLRTENAVLKQDILSRGLPLPPGAMPESPIVQDSDGKLRLPGPADVERAVTLVGRMWHRLVEAITRAQHQVPNKS